MNQYVKKYLLDTEENKSFCKEMRDSLLAFARQFASPEGTAYYLSDDGSPWTSRPRETYETARMAHSYAMGAMLGYEDCEKLVDDALRGLQGELHDDANGGWYPGVLEDGTPQPDKLCYAHAFVILAASSGALIDSPRAKALLEDAIKVYDLRFWNEEEGLSRDLWNTEFTKLDEYRGLNSNMHSVESFLAASDVTGDETYRVRAGRIIDHVLIWAGNNNWRIPEHFFSDWTPNLECNKEKPDDQFKPYGATPGHGLEWGRLITQWATSTFKEDKEGAAKYIEAAENLFNRAIEDAWNSDGAPGVCYTTDWEGKPVVHDRMHWTLAEAINTAAVLYRVTGKEVYADRYAEFMCYLDEKVVDHVNGSWFHQLDTENKLMNTVWPGKPDIYHALQATLIPYYPVDLSIAVAVKEASK